MNAIHPVAALLFSVTLALPSAPGRAGAAAAPGAAQASSRPKAAGSDSSAAATRAARARRNCRLRAMRR